MKRFNQGVSVAKALLLIVVLVGPGISLSNAADKEFKVLDKILIGGEGGWDYLSVNPDTRQLFIAHGTQVEVVDLDSSKMSGTIPDTPGVHGVAVAVPLGVGFISNGKASSVAVFDLLTIKKTAEIPAGQNPDAIMFDPATSRVFVFNGKSHDSTVIDAKEKKVLTTLPLPGKPEFAVSDGKGSVYVNIEDKNSLALIDSKHISLSKTWPLEGCEEPAGLAIDEKLHRLFVGCSNKTLAVVDAENGKIITTLPIGEHSDAVVFDPVEKLIFSSNGDGTLTVMEEQSADKYRVVETVSTQRGARTMALDPQTHRIFLATAEFGEPPIVTAEQPHPRPPIKPGTFTVLIVGK